MDRKSEAQSLLKEATKLSNPSFLGMRLKGEWGQATPLFERAGLLFKQSGDVVTAKTCWEQAATGHIAQKSPWHAAKAMERACEMSRDAKDWPQVKACSERAAELYLEEGKQDTAAEAVVKAARVLEEHDPVAASQLYAQALEWLEDCGKDNVAGDTYRSAIAHQVRTQKWGDAATLSLRFAASCDVSGARHSQCKAYLGAIVIWLYAQDASQAWLTYQDALAVSEFSCSDEAFAAEALLDAYRAANLEAVADAIKSHSTFIHLDNCTARLAKKLPQGDVVAMAKVLGGAGGGGLLGDDGSGEEDLT